MIYDIKKLIDVADFRDAERRADHDERLRSIELELQDLETQSAKDQKEIRHRALALVEQIDGGDDVTRSALQGWFIDSAGRRPLGRSALRIARQHRAREQSLNQLDLDRLGQLQELLRNRLEHGQLYISTDELRKSGFNWQMEVWFERFHKAQARKAFGL